MKRLHNINELEERRRELRKNETKQEEILWFILRDKKLGVKFRRQHSIGFYIADFFSYEKKLIIEIDGKQHYLKDNLGYDKIRDSYLKENGYKVLRIKNSEIEYNLETVIQKIESEIRSVPLP